jgi:ABC-2 type transport system ATP-binding protein
MRVLLRDFADRGGTVLLSSHLLGEVQATVDRLVVISAGRVVAQGALDDLLTSSGLVVRATDTAALHRALDDARIDHHLHEDGSVMVEKHDGVDAERLARLAATAGVLLVELRDGDRTGLEQFFFSLTSGAATAPHAVPQTLEAVR